MPRGTTRIFWIFLVLLYIPYVLASPPQLICNVTTSATPLFSNGCFLAIYDVINSHVALCNQPKYFPSIMGFIQCKIIANDTEGTVIPIEFEYNCNNISRTILYIYNNSKYSSLLGISNYVQNSHVGLDPAQNYIPVCISEKFFYALDKSSVSGTFLIGLYDRTNSHVIANSFVAVSQGKAKYNIFLYIKNYGSPKTEIYPSNNSYSFSNRFFFTDNDTIPLYVCFYRVQAGEYDSGWIVRPCYNYILDLNVTSDEVWIWTKVINVAGNALWKVYRYFLYKPGLYLKSLSGEDLNMIITEGKKRIYLRIGNRANRTIENISFRYSVSEVTGHGSYTKTNCTEIVSLGPYEYKDCYIDLYPYAIGYYIINASVNGETLVNNITREESSAVKVKILVSTDIKKTILSADVFATFWLTLFLITSVILLLI